MTRLRIVSVLILGLGPALLFWRAPDEPLSADGPLSAYVGQDLRSFDSWSRVRLERVLARHIPGRKAYNPQDPLSFFDLQPWALWRLEGRGQPVRWVLFEGDPFVSHPGSTWMRFQVLDKAGRYIRSTEFSTGHRTYLRRFALKPSAVSPYPLLELETGLGPGPGANLFGPNPSRQLYALVGDDWRLIRMESDGKIMAPAYHVKHFLCGPRMRPSGVPDVERALDSPDRGEVLAMLVWLGAHHAPPPADDKSPQYEEEAEVHRHEEALRSGVIRIRLERLVADPDPWVREQAAEVLTRSR